MSLTYFFIVYYFPADRLGPCKPQDKCGINLRIDRRDGASWKKELIFSVLQLGQAIETNTSFPVGKTLLHFVFSKGARLCKCNVSRSGRASRLPKLATPIHWIKPSYLLIKSSNHGLDPFHWFVSRHGRAEGHRNAVLLNPRYEAGVDRLIYAWKSVLNGWVRTKGASIFPFL